MLLTMPSSGCTDFTWIRGGCVKCGHPDIESCKSGKISSFCHRDRPSRLSTASVVNCVGWFFVGCIQKLGKPTSQGLLTLVVFPLTRRWPLKCGFGTIALKAANNRSWSDWVASTLCTGKHDVCCKMDGIDGTEMQKNGVFKFAYGSHFGSSPINSDIPVPIHRRLLMY